MKLYVVHMYRWGDEENHSYIEGVYDTMEKAVEAEKHEREWRANKYEGKIWVHPLNKPRNPRTEMGKVLYADEED